VANQSPAPSESDPVGTLTPALIRAGVGIAAAAHLLYLSLLLTCDVLRVAPRGFVPQFEGARATVSSLVPDSFAARSGLRNGDQLVSVNGQTLLGHTDWQRATLQFDPSRPLVVEVDRDGHRFTAALPVSAGGNEWRRTPQATGVLAFRLVQFGTLAFAVLVAFRRSFEGSALLGSLLLASLATISLALPMRLGVFWHALPAWLEGLLWLPFANSAAAGPLLFAFASIFPRRIWPKRWIAVALIPAALVLAWHVSWGVQLMRELGPPTGVRDAAPGVFLANVGYAAVALGLLVFHRRAATTVTDRRRIGVLILGTATGAAAAIGVIVGYSLNPAAGVFATGPMTLLALVFLALPASFAYAILRHRLFDLRLIIRQGLRYALARKSVDALVPVLGALLLADVIVHWGQPLLSLITTRGWWYLLIAGALLLVRPRREEWLTRVDRRFFRERYDAHRLLTSIAEQVKRASSFDVIAPSIARQIDEALHPTFVSVLTHLAASSSYSSDSARVPESGAVALPASLTVIRLLSVLRKPLALSLGDTAWVRHQLPLEERALLLKYGIELLVPIWSLDATDLPLGLIALGPRRSEEPYGREDLELLTTIAHAVGALLQRSSDGEQGLAQCERCGRCYEAATAVCAHDSQRLIRTPGTILINGRYRLESRLGRGGMGTVYVAMDTALDRPVAVKVIREDVTSALDLDSRFRREARAAASFAHPHVVRVYDFGVERSGRPYLVMELLEGTTLRERLASGAPIDRPEALHILRGVCSALAAAHSRALVHRDLKPENIYLQRHATGIVPKVLDFGLAKALHGEQMPADSTELRTSAGVLLGTLEYMAPEQVAGDEINPAWDVWAVSVIAYEMLTGRHPFRRAVGFGFDGASDSVPTAAEAGHSALAPGIDAFFRGALSRNPSDRPAKADEFLTAIEQVLQ
jgi:eukaryotic-like serine/threonine-protein kinase